MRILVTGAKGFVGKNLIATLKNIKNGYDKTRSNLNIKDIYEYDIDSSPEDLEFYCDKCDFVFHLAGVNRPKDELEFMEGNFGFSSELLSVLKKHKNRCPVMLSSSIQATLIGRYGKSNYGKSKLAGEKLFLGYKRETGADVLIYRFPNLFGKWCRPNYNSVVATFCHCIAHDRPIQVNDLSIELELLYIDDLLIEMLDALEGKEHHCVYNGLKVIEKKEGTYCYVPTTHRASLGEIVELLHTFDQQPKNLMLPEIPINSFEKKLYSTYISYLPKEKMSFFLKTNKDKRGSFTELLKTKNCGQFSVNIIKPGVTKGEHWHHSKWEFFIIVSGDGLIQERKIGTNEVIEFKASGDDLKAIHILPGYAHNIINLSKTENLITLMWANELFDSKKPDTYNEKVKNKF